MRRAVNYARLHIQVGWWSLLFFSVLGFFLETLHGFKVRAYLDVSNETRRLMWTLAHAHGSLLGVVHLIVGLSFWVMPGIAGRHQRLVSFCLIGATILLPAGFFLGGVAFYAGDPGVGVGLVPIGAMLLIVGLFVVARGIPSMAPPEDRTPTRSRSSAR